MIVDRLRTETRREHEAVEALIPLMDSGLTREQYCDTLRRMYRIVHGWESWAVRHAPEKYRDLLAERRRSHLILEDLQSLGEAPIDEATNDIESKLTTRFLRGDDDCRASTADFLGAMYVMEGSTLGGQYIARHVEEKLMLREGKGNAYFRGYGMHTGSMWQGLKQHLMDLPENDGDAVVAAAKRMFEMFGSAMSKAELSAPSGSEIS